MKMKTTAKGKRPMHRCKHCGAEIHDLIQHMAVKHNDEHSQRILAELEEMDRKVKRS